MSGVFGWWQFDGRPLNPEALDACLASLSPQDNHGIHVWTDAAIALGCKSSFTSLESDAGGALQTSVETACVFDGRLDNRDELIRALADRPGIVRDCPDGALAAAAYERWSDRFVGHLQGDFAVAIFDRRRLRLVIARDRLGVRPLCYTQVNGAFLFASEAKALLAHPGVAAIPDEIALADFVLYFRAHDAQSRTFFRGVQSLPPAHLLTVTPQGSTVSRYFEFDTTRRIRPPALRDYAGTLHELLVASVRNRLRSARPMAISVSGGLDSAYIFCVAQQLMRSGTGLCPAVLGFNHSGAPGSPSDEEGFVRAIEDAYDAPIERVPQRSGFMECGGDEVWGSELPIVEGLARQGQALLRRVREAGAGRLLTGHWGDQLLSDSDYLLDLLRSGRWRLLKQHSAGWRTAPPRVAVRFARDLASRRLPAAVATAARRASRREGAAWQSPWYTADFRRLLRARTADSVAPKLSGSSHARSIHQQSRLGYHVRCMEWNNRLAAMHALDIAFPYLDCDLIQFLMSIPGDMQAHGGVPRGLMREAMRGTVPDAIVERRSKGEFTHLANATIHQDFDAVSDILGPGALSVRFGYVDGPVLWKLLPEWRDAITADGDAVLTNRILDLCGLEFLLRRFFADHEISMDLHRAVGVR